MVVPARLRRVIFWLHLCTASVAGVFILIMSVTGALLAYQQEITDWGNRVYRSAPPSPAATKLPLETLLSKVRESRTWLASLSTNRFKRRVCTRVGRLGPTAAGLALGLRQSLHGCAGRERRIECHRPGHASHSRPAQVPRRERPGHPSRCCRTRHHGHKHDRFFLPRMLRFLPLVAAILEAGRCQERDAFQARPARSGARFQPAPDNWFLGPGAPAHHFRERRHDVLFVGHQPRLPPDR